jgi:hypothetical protein
MKISLAVNRLHGVIHLIWIRFGGKLTRSVKLVYLLQRVRRYQSPVYVALV